MKLRLGSQRPRLQIRVTQSSRFFNSRTCLAYNMLTKKNRRQYIRLQPEMKSGYPAYQLQVGRGLDADLIYYINSFKPTMFVLAKKSYGKVFSMPWRARETVVFCWNKPDCIPTCRACPTQQPCCAQPEPSCPWNVRVWIQQVKTYFFPCHPLDDKGLDRQIGVRVLVDIQG